MTGIISDNESVIQIPNPPSEGMKIKSRIKGKNPSRKKFIKAEILKDDMARA